MELVWADEGAVIGKRACFSRKTLKFSVPCVKATSPSSTARPHLVWPKPGKTRSAIAFCCRPGQEPDPRVANQACSFSKRETVNREEVPRIEEECSGRAIGGRLGGKSWRGHPSGRPPAATAQDEG